MQNNIISAEFYKYWKNKIIFSLIAIALFPFIFGFVFYLDIPSMKINAHFNMITYVSSLWTFLISIALPIILFSYISTIDGKNIKEGTIIYELTRIANRKKLILLKIISTIYLFLFFSIIFFISSVVSFMLFISSTRFFEQLTRDTSILNESLIMLLGILFVIFFITFSFYLSLYFTNIIIIIINFVLAIIISVMSSTTSFNEYIPGSLLYGTVVADNKFIFIWFVQAFPLILLIMVFIYLSMKKFNKIDIC